MALFIGIDLGTTTITALALCDAGAPVVAVRSVANDTLKAITRHRHLPLDTATPATIPDPHGHERSPEGVFAAAETRQELRRALEKLTPEQRAVIILRYYQQLSAADVARELAIPSGTVRRRLHDARLRLRRFLLPTGVGY